MLTLVAVALSGCASPGNHTKWKQAATNRYLDVRSNLMLQMGRQQFETGQLDVAQHTVRNAMEIDPANAHLYVLAGRIALERGRLERSYHLFDQAILFSEGQPKDKVAALRKAHDKPSRQNADQIAAASKDAKSQAAQEAREAKRKREQRIIAAAAKRFHPMPEPYYYQGVILQRWQRYPRAYDKYEHAYGLKKDNPAYPLAVCEMLVAMNKSDQAIALLQSKLDYFDQNAGIRNALAQIYSMDKKYDQAAEFFHRALLLDPDNLQTKENLTTALLQANHPEQAVPMLKSLLKDPKMEGRDDLWRVLASAQVKLGDTDQAKQIYHDLTRRNPAEVDDWVKLGELSWRTGDIGGTLMAANQVLNLAPQRHEGYLLAGLVWQKRDRLDDALRMFDRAAQRVPDSALPLILRGMALQQAGRRQAAAKAYQRALKRQPDDTRARKLLRSLAEVTR